MKFSILVPAFNAEKCLEGSIKSVLENTLDDFEIILVDDGSADQTPALCDRFESENPDKIRAFHQKNSGQLASRIAAAKAARGDYCVFLDADDALTPDALETIDAAINSNGFPDMVIYSFVYDSGVNGRRNAAALFDDGTVFDGENLKNLYGVFCTDSLLNNVWTKAVKTEVLVSCSGGLEPYYGWRCSEDRLHSMAMVSACGKVVYIYKQLYLYNITGGSVTRRFACSEIDKFRNDGLYALELEYIRRWGLPFDEYKQKLDSGYAYQTWDLFYKFYTRVKTSAERQRVLNYDWTSFLDSSALAELADNPYLNDTYKMCWDWMIKKDYSSIKKYLMKKKLKGFVKKFR